MSMRPPAVPQSDLARCWAACMESWTSLSAYWDSHTQQYFADTYGGWKGGLDAGSGRFASFLSDYSLGMMFAEAGKLDGSDIEWLLGDPPGGYFMFIEKQGGGVSHARLAYRYTSGKVYAMEPANGTFPGFTPSALKKIMILTPLMVNE